MPELLFCRANEKRLRNYINPIKRGTLMKRCIHIYMFGIIVLLLVVLPLGEKSFVEAKKFTDKSLKGLYAFTLFQSCVADSSGFDEDDFDHVAGGSGPNTFGITGTIQYNGDGTGTVSRRQLIFVDERNLPGVIPLFQADLTCDVAYSVNPDGTFTHKEKNCTGTVTAGTALPPATSPNVGVAITQADIEFLGRMEKDGKRLLFSDTNTNVETVTFALGTFSIKRICNRSGSAFRVNKKVPKND